MPEGEESKKGRCGMNVLTGKWDTGEINGFKFEVKHYEEGSEFGIEGGRISKLRISKDGTDCAAYERGWDIRPTTGEARAVYAELVRRYN